MTLSEGLNSETKLPPAPLTGRLKEGIPTKFVGVAAGSVSVVGEPVGVSAALGVKELCSDADTPARVAIDCQKSSRWLIMLDIRYA